jgi:hypothetical protein
MVPVVVNLHPTISGWDTFVGLILLIFPASPFVKKLDELNGKSHTNSSKSNRILSFICN